MAQNAFANGYDFCEDMIQVLESFKHYFANEDFRLETRNVFNMAIFNESMFEQASSFMRTLEAESLITGNDKYMQYPSPISTDPEIQQNIK